MRFQVKVQPASSKKKIIYLSDGTIKIFLQSAPENNKANKELIKYLSEILGIPKAAVKIIKGQTGRVKLIEIAGITAENIKAAAELT